MSFDTSKAFWFTHVASHNAKHRAFVYGSMSLFNVTTLLTVEFAVFPLLEVWRITHRNKRINKAISKLYGKQILYLYRLQDC